MTMWLSLDRATKISNLANFVLVASLAFGVMSTVIIFWMANIKEMYWEEERRHSNEQVAGLTERTAELNQKAEEDRLARVQLEARMAPRRLSKDEKAIFSARLGFTSSTPTVVVSRMLDPESADFAEDIGETLIAAGWTSVTKVINWTQSNKGVFVATVEDTDLYETEKLSAALAATGISNNKITLTGDAIQQANPWFEAGRVYIIIGAKP